MSWPAEYSFNQDFTGNNNSFRTDPSQELLPAPTDFLHPEPHH